MGEFGIQAAAREAARGRARGGVPGRSRRDDGLLRRPGARGESRSRRGEQPAARALLTLDGKTFVIDRPAPSWAAAAAATSCSRTPTCRAGTSSCSCAATDWYVVDLESTNGVAVNGRRVPIGAVCTPATRSWPAPPLRFDVD